MIAVLLDELGVAAEIGKQEAADVWRLGFGHRIFPAPDGRTRSIQ
jgi:hypothetical protein